MPLRRAIVPLLLLLAALAFGASQNGWLVGGAPHAAAPAIDDGAPLWSGGGDYSAQYNAHHHWRKHGREFPELHSEAQYVAAAHAFVSHPPPGTLSKHNGRGDTLFYDPATNTFAVRAPSGAPRTMFRPSSGMDYWNRQ